MALLPPSFLDAVVALGVGEDPEQLDWIGTGFLYGLYQETDSEGKKRYLTFLISNKHVLKGYREIWIKFNSASDETSKDYEVNLIARNGKPLWVGHPDPEIDIAAIFINPQVLRREARRFEYFRSDTQVFDIKDLKDAGISEGDGIYILGFPMGLVDPSRQYVICRSGGIARIHDTLDGRSKEFLVDALVFPGNSGSPVIIKPELASISGTKSIDRANLIGIVRTYIPYRDMAESKQTRIPRIIFEENSGLTSVLPVDFIEETAKLTRKRIKARMASARRRSKEKNAP